MLVLLALASGCSSISDVMYPSDPPGPTCYFGTYSDDADRRLPECPRSTGSAPLTDIEVERQWEEGERERAEQERSWREESSQAEGTCADVTSFDDNWDNDMLCTRADGTKFYTDYAGADEFLADW